LERAGGLAGGCGRVGAMFGELDLVTGAGGAVGVRERLSSLVVGEAGV
jgi:hypothetical protein